MHHKIIYIIGSFLTYISVCIAIWKAFSSYNIAFFSCPRVQKPTQNCFTTAVYTWFSKLCYFVHYQHYHDSAAPHKYNTQATPAKKISSTANTMQCNKHKKTELGRSAFDSSIVCWIFLRFTYCQCIQGEMTAGAWHCKHQRYKR